MRGEMHLVPKKLIEVFGEHIQLLLGNKFLHLEPLAQTVPSGQQLERRGGSMLVILKARQQLTFKTEIPGSQDRHFFF